MARAKMLDEYFKCIDGCVLSTMACGAALIGGGTIEAICTRSVNWTSVVAACCGAALTIQGFANVKSYKKRKEELYREILDTDAILIAVVENLSCTIFHIQPNNELRYMDLNTLPRFLKATMNKVESLLSEACFWNSIENFSKGFNKEKRYLAEKDNLLLQKLKKLLETNMRIETDDLVIQEDLWERIDELIIVHNASCKVGLDKLDEHYTENAQLAIYLENNEPTVDVKKDSPLREITPEDNREIIYHESPKRYQKWVPNLGLEAAAGQSTSPIYPDSPGSGRDVYYPPKQSRCTPKKTPKKSPKKTPKKSPKH